MSSAHLFFTITRILAGGVECLNVFPQRPSPPVTNTVNMDDMAGIYIKKLTDYTVTSLIPQNLRSNIDEQFL